MSADEVYELMSRAADLPYGEARTVLVEDALRRAEAAADEVLAFRVRMELTGAYQHGGEPAKAFTTFSRSLSEHDRNPSEFPQGTRLLWHFKWIVNSLTLFPEIPLDRTYAVLDDMERRYRLGGHSLQAVHHYRHVVARHVGDDEAADDWYAKWHAALRDELSDCVGCDPTGKVRHLASRGRDEDALIIASPILSAEIDCTEQPQGILTSLLRVYLRTGRLDEARDAHRRAYRLVRANLADLSDIAAHIEFSAVTGNEARALEIVQRHLGWLDRAPSPYAAMRFTASAALALRRLAETGQASGVTLRRPDGEVAATDLQAELTAQALAIAERFDARNATTHQGDLIRALLNQDPVVDHLPLTPYARQAPPPTPAPRINLDEVRDPAELLDAAEEHWIRRETADALAAWSAFDALFAPGDLEPGLAGRRGDGRGFELLVEGDVEAALAEWERAAALHTEADDLERLHSARSRTGAVLCGSGRVEEGFGLLEEAVAYLDGHAPGSRRAVAARLRLATAYAGADRAQDALGVLDAISAPTPVDAADAEVARARALVQTPEGLAGALDALRRACAAYREADARPLLAEAALMLGQLLIQSEDGGDDALAALDEAIRLAPVTLPGLRSSAYASRGSRLLIHGRAADAVEDLIEAVAVFTAEGAHPQAAYARLDLAGALYETGRHLEAAEVAEEAGPMLARLEDVQAERRSRICLAHAQREMGEEDAVQTFVALAEDEEHPGGAAYFLEAAAEVLTGLDKDGLAAERFAEAADAFAAAGDPYGTVRARRRGAMCLSWNGRPEDGLTEMGVARAALGDLPRDNEPALTWESSLVSYDESRLLARLGRLGEALIRVDEAIAGFAGLDEKDAVTAATEFRAEITQSGDSPEE